MYFRIYLFHLQRCVLITFFIVRSSVIGLFYEISSSRMGPVLKKLFLSTLFSNSFEKMFVPLFIICSYFSWFTYIVKFYSECKLTFINGSRTSIFLHCKKYCYQPLFERRPTIFYAYYITVT